MSGRAHGNTFFAKHRPVVLLVLVLIAVYVVAGEVHRFRTYDYTGDAAAPRTSECFLFPVVPLDGDSIKRIVGFARFCFDDPHDLGKYSAVTAAITNR